MNKEQLIASLLESMEDNLRLPRGKINPDETLENIAIDSITFAEVVVDMERRLGRAVPAELLDEIQDTMTVRQLAELIARI